MARPITSGMYVVLTGPIDAQKISDIAIDTPYDTMGSTVSYSIYHSTISTSECVHI